MHAQQEKQGLCPLCRREKPLTFHHLIPRKMHRRPYFKKKYSKSELKTGIYICQKCHSGLHALHDEMTLGKRLNTIQALATDPAVAKHVKWVSKQK